MLISYEQLKEKTKESISGCWEWTARVHTVGYGSVSRKYEGGGYAHRAMYLASKGEIPKGMYVLHKCDNRICINPDHLFLGTHLDNVKDMHSKNRQKGGSMPGEKNPSAKFLDEDIVLIRQAREAGVRKSVIEREFNVSETQYYRIIRHETRPWI
jgi:hypothetical protein